mmetsp:Transcript_47860/g.109119  ORF Transcript_47860/g.109119 Transcript_47860/m.109119 type:complete len:735 (+) Transcript_47860:54-2258(+)
MSLSETAPQAGGMGKTGNRTAAEESMDSFVMSQISMDSMEAALLRPPADIAPPCPKFSKQRLHRVPFLYTDVAKQAFRDPKTLRPGSAALLKSAERNAENTADYGGEDGTSRPPRVGDEDTLNRTAQARSGRLSAPPGGSFVSASASHLGALLASTKRKSKGKRPELFALEAEQRALEAETKAADRQEFEKMRDAGSEYIMQLTKQCNDLKKQRVDMERQYSLLLDRKAAVDADAKGEEHRKAAVNAQRVQDLEAKLEYWMQALREEEAYTKTLLHMQTRSAADKHSRDVDTAECKRRVKGVDHDIRALLARLQESKNEKVEAESVVRDYREEMGLYYERREARMNERRREVQRIQLKDEAMKRLLSEEEEVNRQRSLSSLAAGNEAALAARKHELFQAALEAGFNKVMSITGLENIEQLEAAFVFDEQGVRHDRTEEFTVVLERNKNLINDLNDKRIELEKQLLKVKFSGSANDAERDEIEEAHSKQSDVRRRTAVTIQKLATAERLLIKTRSGFELLATKLEQVGLLEMLTRKERGDDTEALTAEMLEGGSVVLNPRRDAFGSNEEEEEPAPQGEGNEGGEEGDEEEEEDLRRRARNLKAVDDPERGVVAIMRRSMDRLAQVYHWLEENYPGGVPEQNAAAAKDLRLSRELHVGLTDLVNNYRIPMDLHEAERRTSPRREDDGLELEDRAAIKWKADKLVARRKKEQANRFDEYGNEIAPPAAPAKLGGKKK